MQMLFLGKTLFSDFYKIIFTFLIALICAQIFIKINVPAPYFIGSLLGVWFIGASISRTRPLLVIADWFYLPVIIGISVLIGTNFTPEVVQSLQKWLATVCIMIIATSCVTIIAFQFLTRIKLYEPKQAFLCSIPGGQAEALVIARELVEKDYIVALFHLVRIAIIFITTPLLLMIIQGPEAIQRSNTILEEMPNISALSVNQACLFLGLCISGYWIAKFIKMPMPHLLGPIFLSSILHFLGMLELPRINEFVIMAQITIGASVGARLAQISFSELKNVLLDACVTSGLIIVTYLAIAILITLVWDVEFLSIWLAFVPGGLYEATILALIFGFDVAFVAFHHLVRVLLIFVSMPVFIKIFHNRR